MGSCTSGLKKRRKGDSAPAEEVQNQKPGEDVTYASINHSSGPALRRPQAATDDDNDCDYTLVKMPARNETDAQSESSKEECADDYVLMG
ncbi:uncharacterized protein si:ch211-214p13.7 [Cololabis saira]|uniref:uncharacterized protein si:ch211-214p13.7 n=1 Tax=Cololabis saira TaxID=129043 RepID=UPI002AD2900F|nr:uncharacterized protein si:ch211-214p13.7 [Cololabis saira]